MFIEPLAPSSEEPGDLDACTYWMDIMTEPSTSPFSMCSFRQPYIQFKSLQPQLMTNNTAMTRSCKPSHSATSFSVPVITSWCSETTQPCPSDYIGHGSGGDIQ
nr:uncharacterized protein CTRU02_03154 [Colletotrichum truncatum]KAF6797123.1 hypothetical protein CTRU02_03154 [Colletotrichum truncatum]